MIEILYEHLVQYYETDKMGCVHHSNYIRWFEEARTKWLEELGFPYPKIESMGIMIPVFRVETQYLSMTHFGETAVIKVIPEKYSGAKISFSYCVTDKATGALRCTGKTQHGFLNAAGKPVSLKKAIPELHDICMRKEEL